MINSSERINIKSLTIEGPKAEEILEPFDPIPMIADSAWEDVALVFSETDNSFFEVRRAAFQTAYLKPEILDSLNLKSRDFIRIGINENAAYFQNLEFVTMLFPQEASSIPVPVDLPEIKEGMLLGEAGRLVDTKRMEEFAAYRRLFPEDEEVLQGRHYIFEANAFFLKDEKNISRFSTIAADLRVIYPNRFAEIEFPRNFWKDAREEIARLCKTGNFGRLADFAYHLRILAAQEIHLTDKGMELVLKQDQVLETSDIPAQPTVRRF